MIQIWVNLPRSRKLTQAKYQALTGGIIPEAPLPGGGGVVRVVSGSFGEARGAASTFTPAHMLDLRLRPGATARLATPKDYNTALLALEGRVKANGSPVLSGGQFVLFKNDGDEVVVEAVTEATVLFLSGEPIEEPLVHYGPFVMNTRDEINEAIEDYNAGKFGHLEAPPSDAGGRYPESSSATPGGSHERAA
jgi:redox-sensitive bicupin YhaK (pirin superfamily)